MTDAFVDQEPGGGIQVTLETRIANRGPATAEVAMFSVEARDLGSPVITAENHWEPLAENFFRCRYPLPPNLIVPRLIRISGVLLSGGATAVFRFFTHNTPVHHSIVTFTQDELLACLTTKKSLIKQGRSDPIYP